MYISLLFLVSVNNCTVVKDPCSRWSHQYILFTPNFYYLRTVCRSIIEEVYTLQFYRVDMMCSAVHIKMSWVSALYLLMHWLLFKATAFTPRLAGNMLQSAPNCPYPNNCHLKSDWTFLPVEPSFKFIELQNLLSHLGFGLPAIIARYNYHICSCEV